jgi:hypothetical protein
MRMPVTVSVDPMPDPIDGVFTPLAAPSAPRKVADRDAGEAVLTFGNAMDKG